MKPIELGQHLESPRLLVTTEVLADVLRLTTRRINQLAEKIRPFNAGDFRAKDVREPRAEEATDTEELVSP